MYLLSYVSAFVALFASCGLLVFCIPVNSNNMNLRQYNTLVDAVDSTLKRDDSVPESVKGWLDEQLEVYLFALTDYTLLSWDVPSVNTIPALEFFYHPTTPADVVTYLDDIIKQKTGGKIRNVTATASEMAGVDLTLLASNSLTQIESDLYPAITSKLFMKMKVKVLATDYRFQLASLLTTITTLVQSGSCSTVPILSYNAAFLLQRVLQDNYNGADLLSWNQLQEIMEMYSGKSESRDTLQYAVAPVMAFWNYLWHRSDGGFYFTSFPSTPRNPCQVQGAG